MKKVLAILAAIVFCGFGANAQGKSCPVPGTSQSIQITSFQKESDGYTVHIKNSSSKKVYFKVTAEGCNNVKQCVVYDQVASVGGINVKFEVDDSSKPFRIADVTLSVTGCDE